MTAPRQFALVCLGIVAFGLALAFFRGKPSSEEKKPETPGQAANPPAAPVGEASKPATVSAEGCVTPTPEVEGLCHFHNATPLPVPLGAAAAAVAGDHLYVVGGATNVNGAVAATTVYYAALDAQGNPGAWGTTTPYPIPVIQHGAVAHGGYLYVVGGAIPTDSDNLVQTVVNFARVNADGTLGEWKKGPDLPEPVAAGGVVLLNDVLYVLGGYSTTGPGTTSTGSVYFTTFKPNGSLAPWKKTTPLTGGRFFFAAAAGQGAIYALGGTYRTGGQQAPFSEGGDPCQPSRVLIGRVAKDGTIAAWTQGTPFEDMSLAANAFVVGDRLLLVQSRGRHAPHGSADLLSAPIRADSSIGDWHVIGKLPEVAASRAGAIGPAGIYAMGGTAVVKGEAVLLPATDVIPLRQNAVACSGP